MAKVPHPVTRVMINEIEVLGREPTDKERETARLLAEDGDPRWLAAAKIGVHPLEIDPTGRDPRYARRSRGGHLSGDDARKDPRQMGFGDLDTPPED